MTRYIIIIGSASLMIVFVAVMFFYFNKEELIIPTGGVDDNVAAPKRDLGLIDPETTPDADLERLKTEREITRKAGDETIESPIHGESFTKKPKVVTDCSKFAARIEELESIIATLEENNRKLYEDNARLLAELEALKLHLASLRTGTVELPEVIAPEVYYRGQRFATSEGEQLAMERVRSYYASIDASEAIIVPPAQISYNTSYLNSLESESQESSSSNNSTSGANEISLPTLPITAGTVLQGFLKFKIDSRLEDSPVIVEVVNSEYPGIFIGNFVIIENLLQIRFTRFVDSSNLQYRVNAIAVQNDQQSLAVTGETDYRFWIKTIAVLGSALLSVGGEIASTNSVTLSTTGATTEVDIDADELVAGEFASGTSEIIQENILDKYLNLPTVVKLPAGESFGVLVLPNDLFESQ